MVHRCKYCTKIIKDIAVANDLTGKLFCAGSEESSPLQEDSCARRYINQNPEDIRGNYFFISVKIKDKNYFRSFSP